MFILSTDRIKQKARPGFFKFESIFLAFYIFLTGCQKPIPKLRRLVLELGSNSYCFICWSWSIRWRRWAGSIYDGGISARSGTSITGFDYSVPNSWITDCGSACFGGKVGCFDDFSGPFWDISTTHHRIHEGKETIGSRKNDTQ